VFRRGKLIIIDMITPTLPLLSTVVLPFVAQCDFSMEHAEGSFMGML